MTIAIFYPTGDGTTVSTDYTANTGNRWQCIDDIVASADDATTYIYGPDTNNNARQSQFSAPIEISAGATITKVSLLVRGRKTNWRTSGYWGGAILNTTDNSGSQSAINITAPTESYVDYTIDWLQNPFTTADWTVDDVNGVGTNSIKRFSLYHAMGSSAVSRAITQAYFAIEFTGGAAGPTNLKNVNSLIKANTKTMNGLAMALIKSANGLT